jgi:predicted DNA-binding transcriptional regulator AlpA
VTSKWLGKEGFANFYNDVGERPSDNHSLDRYPDNNGNYEPGNVRWATRQEQSENRRNTQKVIYHGEEMTVDALSKLTGVKRRLIYQRAKAGEKDDALIRDVTRLFFNYQGKEYNLTQLSELTGLDRQAIYDRIRAGKTVEEALSPEPLFNYPEYDYNGEMKTIPVISKLSGIPEGTLRQRAANGLRGADLVRSSRSFTYYTYKGHMYSIPQLEAITGISKTTLSRHLNKESIDSDKTIDRLVAKSLRKRDKSLNELVLLNLQKNANKDGVPLPCDMVMVENPDDPSKKIWVPKPGWKPYDV